jgi:hypothetical protein
MLAWARLESRNPSELVEEIISKAAGVFLWVVLSVRSLLEGLQNYDGIGYLRQRLRELPEDLQRHCQHMLHRMSPRYRAQAACILQMVLQSLTVQADRPLAALQLYFAIEYDLRRSIAAQVDPLAQEVKAGYEEIIEGHARSRCCGLVEIYPRRVQGASGNNVLQPTVGFLHRTVAARTM